MRSSVSGEHSFPLAHPKAITQGTVLHKTQSAKTQQPRNKEFNSTEVAQGTTLLKHGYAF